MGPQGQPVDAKGMPLHEPTSTPCIREREASYGCLSANDYKQSECAAVFQAYTECKVRRAGGSAALPKRALTALQKRWGEEKAYYRKKMQGR